jgi:hypothetical protein
MAANGDAYFDPNANPQSVDPSTLAAPQSGGPGAFPQGQNDIMAGYNKAFGLEKQAAGEQFNAASQKSQGEASAFQDEQNQLRDLQIDHAARMGALDKRSNDLFQAASQGKIDPDHYWNNMSTSKKIGTTIGVLLSGIGAGASKSTHNLALEGLNKSIDNDIDAQKTNMGQANNLYKMNLEQTHNEMEAHLQTKADMLSMTGAKINQIAAQAGTPMAQAQRDQLLAQIGLQQAQIHQQLATTGLSRAAYTDGIPPQAAALLSDKQRENMVVMPDGRMADAVSSNNAKEYNENSAAYNGLMSNLKELKSLNSLGNLMDPAARERVKSLMGTITVQLNDFSKSHRISEQDVGFQKGQMGDPNSVSNHLLGIGTAGTDQLMKSLTNIHESVMGQYVPALANKQNRIKALQYKRNNG